MSNEVREVEVDNSSPGYSVTVRIKLQNLPGKFATVVAEIAKVNGSLAEVTLVSSNFENTIRDVTISCSSAEHGEEVVAQVLKLTGVELLSKQDDTFAIHRGGKITVECKEKISNVDQLARAYTPGVARVCQYINKFPESAYNFTIKRNSCAVVTDGSAVLGLGNIGAIAAMPVMEGKAMLFKQFGDVDAYPICLDTQNTDEIIKAVKQISPGFGSINLEDISAPRCFEIEERLQKELDIPVFHDDQHGTAVVVCAALVNALKLVNKKFSELKVVINGFGAGGVAITKMLISFGVQNIIPCDSKGIVYKGRPNGMNAIKNKLSEVTNKDLLKGNLADAMKEADIFIGVSQPGLVSREMVKSMAKDPIVFALANPIPEVFPSEIDDIATVIATGRSDFPNQVNNVLAFPGIIKGALESGAKKITESMKMAASYAIAESVSETQLSPKYVIPGCFDLSVGDRVRDKVIEAAIKEGVCREQYISSNSLYSQRIDKVHSV